MTVTEACSRRAAQYYDYRTHFQDLRRSDIQDCSAQHVGVEVTLHANAGYTHASSQPTLLRLLRLLPEVEVTRKSRASGRPLIS